MLSPSRPKMPFTYVVNGYSDMSLSKGHLGSRGGGGGGGEASKNKLKDTIFIFCNDKRHNFICISYACAEGIG